MTAYIPPRQDMAFVLNHVVGLGKLAKAADLDEDTVNAILEEAGKLAGGVLAPLNHPGDKEGCSLQNGEVRTPKGFKDAYNQYRDGGWNAVPFDPAHGGQGLPWAMAFAVQEMWQSANMSFGLCPLLNQGAVEAIESHGSQEQKDLYLEKLVSGEWTGTMNLTEPQAGSDLSAIRSRAQPQPDGTFRISGQKIFITYGEHDLASNIIHLVLARTPNAPEGVKGISLFVVPKLLPDGTRNDLACTGIEHKLGIHASPTCTMQFGDKGGATGTLVGKENEGIKYMFTMMNNARLSVGLQGVAIAERAYQQALDYAKNRIQSKALEGGDDRIAIIGHPDVMRMLLTMKAQVEAARALTYEAAISLDRARAGDAKAQAKVDLLTPIVKAWGTDMANEVASTGVQIHGGMGFIEETGAAQYFRDARILPIYEGTNGIQAGDLAFRKLMRDGGAALQDWFREIEGVCGALDADAALKPMGSDIRAGLDAAQRATSWMLKTAQGKDLNSIGAVYVPYLKGLAVLSCAAMMGRSVMAAQKVQGLEPGFAEMKTATAAFFVSHILPQVHGHVSIVLNGAPAVRHFQPNMF